jgi:hypothetical protein
MTRDELIATLHALLDDHVVWRRSHWDVRGYKRALFRMFSDAYDEGFFGVRGLYAVTGARLQEEVIARYIQGHSDRNVFKLGVLEKMCTEWDAWRYAWDHHPARTGPANAQTLTDLTTY